MGIKVVRDANTQAELFEEVSSLVTKGSIYRVLAYKVKRVVQAQAGLILGITPRMLRQC